MKRWKRLSAWVFVLGFSLSLTMILGCSNDEVVQPDECSALLQSNLIIMNPLAPAPGDTTTLTVQAEGEGCGNWASYTWTAEGGELLQDKGITVKWVAPMEYGAYRVQCRASLAGASPDTSEALVMIKEFEYLETGLVASVSPMVMLNNLYFIAEEGNVGPRNNQFLGWAVYKRSTTGFVSQTTNTGETTNGGSYEFDVVSSGEAIFGSFINFYYSGLRQQRMNTWKFPTLFGAAVNVSADNGGMGLFRKNQHRYPKANSSGTKAVWKFHFVGPKNDGTADLFNVAYWDEADGPAIWHTITQSHDSQTKVIGPDTVEVHRYYNNIRPMFTPDDNNILYFVDTTGVFEPCLIPMVGGQPDTLQRRALMVDERTGIFKQAGVEISENTVFEWNPDVDFLSFIAQGQIVFFDYASETVAIVSDLSKVSEFTWAPDGTQLVAVNDIGVYLVGAGGTVAPDPVFRRERATDDIKGISWNNDGAEPKLAFRLIRKGKSEIDSWSALVIVDLNTGLWAYASNAVPWHSSREPSNIDYTWMRTLFDVSGTGVYAPFAVLDEENYPGKDIILIHSHE